jgi:hypothetical protein
MGLKDRLFETVALPLLNRSVLAPYGQARELRLDSKARSAEIVVDLKGEPEPVTVVVGRYDLFEKEGATYVVLHDVSTSREWMTELVRRNVIERPFKVPKEYAGVVAKLV